MDLTIVAVAARPLRFPLGRPIGSALGTYHHVDCTVVNVHTQSGASGMGFTACLGGESSAAIVPYIEAELAPVIVGRDASDPETLWTAMWAPNKPRLRGGLGAWALSAVDIALWDVAAKAAGKPLVVALGAEPRAVPVYGSGGWLSLSDQELVAEAAGFVEQGVRAYKYKIGGERDDERTALLRRELGDELTLLADANQRFSVAEAVEASRMLAEHDVGWLEEPVLASALDDQAAVAARSAVPVAAGENAYFRWEFRAMAERQAAAFFQPDVGRAGGVSEFRRIAAIAESSGLSVSTHLWHELSVSVLACTPATYLAEYAPLIPAGALTHDFPVVDGAVEVPATPGHGVEFTPAALAHFGP